MAERPPQVQMAERFLSAFPILRVPNHVIVVPGLLSPAEGRLAIGASLSHGNDRAVILTKDSDEETVAHELLHQVGLGEMGAYALDSVFVSLLDIKKRLGLDGATRQFFKECVGCNVCGPVETQIQGARCFVRA